MSHLLGHLADLAFSLPPGAEGHAQGYRRAVLVDRSAGAVHTQLTLNELQPGGLLPPHLHSYETASFILAGQAIATVDGRAARLAPNDYFLAPVGLAHGWRNPGPETLRWLAMSAPQPRPAGPPDIRFLEQDLPSDAPPPDFSDPATRGLGQFDPHAMPGPGAVPGVPVAIRMLVDEALGARMLRTFIIELPPGADVVLHDHPLEESYFLLAGECEITLADGRHPFRPGDFAWAGVGSPHAFHNTGAAPARWLETQAPQPPLQDAFRAAGAWARALQR